jgi:hypothetical protein
MSVTLQHVGSTGNMFGCDLPCFSIDGFTNSFFSMSACGDCDSNTNYNASYAWDGVLRPVIPIVVNVPNAWDGCTYGFRRNGANSFGIHNGKNITEPAPGAGGSLHIGSTTCTLTIRCVDGSTTVTIWQGTQPSRFPDSQPFIRVAGCSATPASLTLTKLTGAGCLCDDYDPNGCEDADGDPKDCTGCPPVAAGANCIQVVSSGFSDAGGDANCAFLNTTNKFTRDGGNSCLYSTNRSGSPEAEIRCVSVGNGFAIWRYQDGVSGKGAQGLIKMVETDETCFPLNDVSFDMYGVCNCASQTGRASLTVGAC